MNIGSILKLARTSVAVNSFAALASGAARPLIGLISLPLLGAAVGQEMLGFWMAALAVTGIFGCLNTGVSVSVVTAVADGEPPHVAVRDGLALSLLCALIYLLLGVVLLGFLDMHAVLQLSDALDPAVVDWVFVIVLLSLAIGIPSQLGRYVAIGECQGYRAQIMEVISLISTPLSLIAAILAGLGVIWFSIAYFIVPTIVLSLLSAIYIAKKGYAASRGYRVKTDVLKARIAQAAPMATHQGLLSLNQHGDVLIVGILIGPVEAALYGVGQRLCALGILAATAINHAFWPELTQLHAKGQIARLKSYFWAQMAISLAIVLGLFVTFALFANFAIRLWMGPDYVLDTPLILGQSAAMASLVMVMSIEMLLRAQKQFGFIFKCTAIGVSISLLVKVLAAAEIGPAGVAASGAVFMALIVGVPYALKATRPFRETVL